MNENNTVTLQGPMCPIPLPHTDQIVMGHGSGGRMTQELIRRVFMPHFSNPLLDAGNDFAIGTLPGVSKAAGRIAISTDSHIVTPLFFPGGDIGRLAVCGTVNDVAMSGANPLYLSAGFILEEGLSFDVLENVVASMESAAKEAGVQIVAGDTKVVEKGKADQLFINTTGIGWIPDGIEIGGEKAQPGDIVLISGTMGDHGIAVLEARGELGFQTQIKSDVAPLNLMIQNILKAAPKTHVLRDPTRGGLATTLNEIANQSNVCITLDERKIPVLQAVRAACEIMGFDPYYVANEGKLIAIVPEEQAESALAAMKESPYGENAASIGRVEPSPQKRVLLRTPIGGTRIMDVLSGEMLPRIC